MKDDKTARVLRSAARWLQRRARKKSGTQTKAAYREAIVLVNGLVKRHAHVPARRTTPDAK